MFRTDPRGRHRRPGLLQDVAAERHRLHVGRLICVNCGLATRRRRRPCGRDGRSRPRRCPSQHRADVARLLGVPGERAHAEAVEQRDEPCRPLGVVQVDRVDAGSDRSCACRSSGTSIRLLVRRVDELDASSSRSGRSASTSGEQTQSRSSASWSRATDKSAGAAAGSFTSTERSKSVPSSSYTSASRGTPSAASSSAAVCRTR